MRARSRPERGDCCSCASFYPGQRRGPSPDLAGGRPLRRFSDRSHHPWSMSDRSAKAPCSFCIRRGAARRRSGKSAPRLALRRLWQTQGTSGNDYSMVLEELESPPRPHRNSGGALWSAARSGKRGGDPDPHAQSPCGAAHAGQAEHVRARRHRRRPRRGRGGRLRRAAQDHPGRPARDGGQGERPPHRTRPGQPRLRPPPRPHRHQFGPRRPP